MFKKFCYMCKDKNYICKDKCYMHKNCICKDKSYICKSKCYRCMEKYDINLEQMKIMELDGALIVDIRSPQEYNEGHINGAISLPDYEIYRNAQKVIPNKQENIIVYCGTGTRSKKAQRLLQRLGYTNVYNLYKGTENYCDF